MANNKPHQPPHAPPRRLAGHPASGSVGDQSRGPTVTGSNPAQDLGQSSASTADAGQATASAEARVIAPAGAGSAAAPGGGALSVHRPAIARAGAAGSAAGRLPAVQLSRASLDLGGRRLWQDLDIAIQPGEFVAVLGPNGAGKTSLLKVLLGLYPLSAGHVTIAGQPPRRGSPAIGYVPQRQSFDPDLPVRGRDLVRLGLDGHRFGPSWRNPRAARQVEQAIREVGAAAYANAPVGLLSGGEQQRLRIAQALIGDPRVLLCDEPLLSLDLSHQQAVSQLIDQHRRRTQAAVIFVTHEINPILPLVDRVLYLVGGRWAVGTPDQVLTTERLTQLYGVPVDVLRIRGRIIVAGTGEAALAEAGGHHSHPAGASNPEVQ